MSPFPVGEGWVARTMPLQSFIRSDVVVFIGRLGIVSDNFPSVGGGVHLTSAKDRLFSIVPYAVPPDICHASPPWSVLRFRVVARLLGD